MRPLVIMPCSGTKRRDAGLLPASERYDGPMWRTLRVVLRDLPPVDVWFLSARFGFHPATLPIPDYDQRMTEARAAELLAIPSSNRHAFASAVAEADAVLFAGGRLYRDTMRRGAGDPRRPAAIYETTGPGLGYQRAGLRDWLEMVSL